MAGLLGLSFLVALRPLLRDLLPNLPHADGRAADWVEVELLALMTVMALALAGIRRCRWPVRAALLKCVWVGLGLFVAPALARAVPEPVPGLTAVALFAMVTVFAAVLEPYLSPYAGPNMGGSESVASARAMPAGIACVAGMFLIFPVALPGTFQETVGFFVAVIAAGCVAAANCVGVSLLRWPERDGARRLAVAPVLAISAGVSVFGLAGLAMLRCDGLPHLALRSGFWWAAMVDVPAVFLLFWLMRRMMAAQTALRFVLGPVSAVLIEALALQQHLTIQTWAGLLVAAAGAVWMLMARERKPESPQNLLFPGQ